MKKILLLIAVVAIGIFTFWKLAPANDWITYSNSEVGLTFSLPKGYVIQETPEPTNSIWALRPLLSVYDSILATETLEVIDNDSMSPSFIFTIEQRKQPFDPRDTIIYSDIISLYNNSPTEAITQGFSDRQLVELITINGEQAIHVSNPPEVIVPRETFIFLKDNFLFFVYLNTSHPNAQKILDTLKFE